eukprot:1294902-Amphidinium_carterae.1
MASGAVPANEDIEEALSSMAARVQQVERWAQMLDDPVHSGLQLRMRGEANFHHSASSLMHALGVAFHTRDTETYIDAIKASLRLVVPIEFQNMCYHITSTLP